ncbi:hypothetical protein P3L10_029158 [Capsicum annuum]
MQHVRGGGKPLRMNQSLRAAFVDASDPPIRDAFLNHFGHCHPFPKEICHDFHPGYDHTLVLRPFQLVDDEEKFHCAACGFDSYELSLFRSYYFCGLCNFNLHVECASIPIDGFSDQQAYCCTKCDFFIDCYCASAPKTLTLKDVNYKLCFSFPFKHEKAVIKCNSCSNNVVTKDGMLYYNMERDEPLHVSCALIKESGNDCETQSNLSVQRLNELRIVD